MRKCNNTCIGLSAVVVKYRPLIWINDARCIFIPVTGDRFDAPSSRHYRENLPSPILTLLDSIPIVKRRMKSRAEINCGLKFDGFMGRGVLVLLDRIWLQFVQASINKRQLTLTRACKESTSRSHTFFPSQRVNNWSTKEKPRVSRCRCCLYTVIEALPHYFINESISATSQCVETCATKAINK